MMSKGKGRNERPRKGDQLIAQMGLLGGMPPDEDDDDDLEAELLRLQGGSAPVKPKKKKTANQQVDIAALQKMADGINLEIGSDEDLSGDEDDLMKELEGLSSDEEEMEVMPAPPKPQVDASSQRQLIERRIDLYTRAIPTADSAKKRRYERALKTMQGQLRTVKAGKTVDPDEIPPEIVIKAAGPTHTDPTHTDPPAAVTATASAQSDVKPAAAPPSQMPTEYQQPIAATAVATPAVPDDPRLRLLYQRRAEYQKASLDAKHAGDNRTAMKYLRIKKDFDNVITAITEGKEVDLSNIPPPPDSTASIAATSNTSSPQAAAVVVSSTQKSSADDELMESLPNVTEEDNKTLFHAPDAPTDTLSALEQRLSKYAETEAEAKQQGNSSKARRMGRITKQYQDAIKAYKAGRPVDFSELPTPPGFAEIPLPGGTPGTSAAPATAKPAAVAPAAAAASTSQQPAVAPAAKPATESVKPRTAPKRQASLSIQGKQFEEIKQRSDQYKKAALDAKNHGDKELALKYMRVVKGMEPMLQAAENGLPVDMSQLPAPPFSSHNTGFVMVEESEVADITDEERKAEFETIITQLKTQVKTCSDNTASFKKMGDVKNAFVFEDMEKSFAKDLDSVQNAFRHGEPVPKYHYENKQYTIVKINTDLGDSDLELSIIRAIQIPLPDGYKPHDLDTYVTYDLPWPQEEGQKGKTDWAKHSDNPEFNFHAKLKIDRRSKAMHRIMKNRKLKLELFFHRGFLKSHKHFSTVNIKLDKFDSSTTIHDSFDLMDSNGRKEIGGKLEVKLRIREPLSQKQVEVVNEKWLIIDQLVRLNRPNAQVIHADPVVPSKQVLPPSSASQVSLIQSIEVLKFEKKELDTKIRQLQATKQLSAADVKKLRDKSAQMAYQIDDIVNMMRKNQLSPHEYLQTLTRLLDAYNNAAADAAKEGNQSKQRLNLVKRDLVHREIRAWKAKISVS